MLLCPHATLTFYPVAYPATTGGIAILSASHYIDETSPVVGALEQVVRRVDYPRAPAPGIHVRGGRALPMEWEEVRRIADPAVAVATAMDIIATMPADPGWVEIVIADQARTFAIHPAAVQSAGYTHDVRKGLLRLRWRIMAGDLTEVATSDDAGMILDEAGAVILCEDEAYLASEAA